jgi:hypothetical protein
MAVASYAQARVHSALGVMALTAILLAAACTSGETSAFGPTPTTTGEQHWRTEITRVPPPRKGCFKAVYPKLEWRQVSCTRTPTYPQPPPGAWPATVGNSK